MNLYLDIDGVLLMKNQRIPTGLLSFLKFTTTHFDCFWLTTHCRLGENKAVAYLSQFVSNEMIELLQLVKSTDWNTLKTEAIDFSKDFVWLDDNPFNAEKQVLVQYEKLHCLIVVDLKRKNELRGVMEELKKMIL